MTISEWAVGGAIAINGAFMSMVLLWQKNRKLERSLREAEMGLSLRLFAVEKTIGRIPTVRFSDGGAWLEYEQEQ